MKDLLLKKEKGGNDPEDYLPTDQAKHDFAEFYQSQLQGINIVGVNVDVPIGGICVLKYHKVTDSIKSHTSGVSLAARDFYQWIRSGQSGATNYQGVDIELYLQGVAEIIDQLEICKRFYRMANTYDRLSVTWPTKIFRAIFGNNTFLPDLVANMSDFRGRINQMCRMVSSFNFPADLPYVKVRRHLSSNVFIEKEDNARTQLFIYIPGSMLVYNETKYTTGGCLERIPINWGFSNYSAFSTYLDAIEGMISNFKASNTNTTMNGDIYRKYDKEGMLDKLYVYSELHDLEALVPLYDEHILERIRNTSVIDQCGFGDIVQADNCIWSIILSAKSRRFGANTQHRFNANSSDQKVILPNAAFPGTIGPTEWTDFLQRSAQRIGNNGVWDFGFDVGNESCFYSGHVLNFEKYPDVNMNIEATRHTVLCNGYYYSTDGNSDYYNPNITHGSEIVYSCELFLSDDTKVVWRTYDDSSIGDIGVDEFMTASHFKYVPILHYTHNQAVVPALPQIDAVATELEQFGLLEYKTLFNLNKQALITEFSSATVTNLMSRLTGK